MIGIAFYEENFPVIKEDRALITENLTRLLLTLPGEFAGNPLWGCRLREFLFDFENIMHEEAEQAIVDAVSTWEPRVVIDNIDMYKDEEVYGKFYIVVDLTIKENLEQINLELNVTV